MNFFMGGDKWGARTQRYSVPFSLNALAWWWLRNDD